MNRVFLMTIFVVTSVLCFGQSPQTNSGGKVVTVQPKIMVIPRVVEGDDMRTVLDKSPSLRVAITKVKEAFDKRGFTTVDFVTKLKAAKEANIITGTNQNDIKSQLILFSGADIYVETDLIEVSKGDLHAVTINLSGNEASTGNSLSNKSGRSGEFRVFDAGALASKAVERIADDFLNIMQTKFTDIVENGKSIMVDISFSQNSTHSMSMEIQDTYMPFSDLLEEWMAGNAYKNNYTIQGATNKRLIFSDVKIPLKNQQTGRNYSTNKFALLLYKYLRKDLKFNDIVKDVKSNSIYITIK